MKIKSTLLIACFLLLGCGKTSLLLGINAPKKAPEKSAGFQEGLFRDVYIINAPGNCVDCASAIQRMLASDHRPSTIIAPVDVSSRVRRGIDVLVAPGGEDYDLFLTALHAANADDFITRHVEEGGVYIGHCLGADIVPMLNIFLGTTTDPSAIKTPLGVPVRWGKQPAARVMYFEDGPVFFPLMPYSVIARFGTDGPGAESAFSGVGIPSNAPAAIAYDWGNGRVGLISSHPEADETWMKELGDEAPDELTYDLGLNFYDHVLQPSLDDTES